MTIKPLAFAGMGAGAIGVPTAIYYADGGQTFASEYSVPSPETLSLDSKTSSLDKAPADCAGRFFPGVKFGTSKTSGQDGNIPDHNVETGKQVGCALLRLDYKSSTEFAFAAEIAAKNGTHGWSVQVYVNTKNEGGSDSSVDSQQRFTYTIFWLTRDSYTKKWKVSSGVYVQSKSTFDPLNSNISFPNKTILTEGNRASGITDANNVWLGVWEETSSNNKRIFEGVKLQYNQLGDSQMCLGEPVSGDDGDSCCDTDCGSNQIMEIKKTYKNNTWSDNTGQFSEIRDKYQQQLRSKTGTWTWYDNIQNFCDTLKSDASQTKKLKNFCHVYKN